ncbi:MAG: outer membrane beta-barrel protein [Candidatus Zixiibacteriota bacterium]
MKKVVYLICIMALSASIVSAAAFEKGKTYVGPTIGLAWKGFGIGISGDHAIDKNWGIGGEVSYTGFSEKYSAGATNYKWKYTFIGVLAAGSYHFIVKTNPKLDPYLKAGLGYFHWSGSYSDNSGNSYKNLYSAGYSSGVGFTGAGGLRYWLKPKMAGRVQVGYPFYIGVGLDWVM